MGKRNFHLNWYVIITAILLVTLGLVTILSIDTSSFIQQLIFAVFGIFLFGLFSRLDFSLYQYLHKVLYLFCVIFLLTSYLGPNVRGATRWLTVGSVNIQPSEIVKPFFLLSIAGLLIEYPPTRWKRVAAHGLLFLPVFLIILRQPDLGSSLVYTSMWLGMIIVAGLPLRYMFGAISFLLVLFPVLYELLHDYQKQRITTFLNPLIDPRGAGYNAIQSMIAVGSGGLFGRGFGRGTQSLLRFLPERHTDFIFASFAEEFGFMGTFALLGIFFLLLLQLVKSAHAHTQDPFAFYFITGLFMQLLTHVMINVGMNVGIVPITGITLPFVSYGGSSLIATFICLGLYMAAIQKKRTFEE